MKNQQQFEIKKTNCLLQSWEQKYKHLWVRLKSKNILSMRYLGWELGLIDMRNLNDKCDAIWIATGNARRRYQTYSHSIKIICHPNCFAHHFHAVLSQSEHKTSS